MLKQTIETAYDLRRAFKAYDRQDSFSWEGYEALIEYFTEIGDVELDVIAICFDFSEYESFEELARDYNEPEDMDDLRDMTWAVELPSGGLLILNY